MQEQINNWQQRLAYIDWEKRVQLINLSSSCPAFVMWSPRSVSVCCACMSGVSGKITQQRRQRQPMLSIIQPGDWQSHFLHCRCVPTCRAIDPISEAKRSLRLHGVVGHTHTYIHERYLMTTAMHRWIGIQLPASAEVRITSTKLKEKHFLKKTAAKKFP